MNNYKIYVQNKDGNLIEQKGTFVYIEDVTFFITKYESVLFDGERIVIEPIRTKEEFK
jgi:hypothetical protein